MIAGLEKPDYCVLTVSLLCLIPPQTIVGNYKVMQTPKH